MRLCECLGVILEGKQLRVVLPPNCEILGYNATSTYIGVFEDNRLISVASAGADDLDWEVDE